MKKDNIAAVCNECGYADNEGEGFLYCDNAESKYYGDCVEDACVNCKLFCDKKYFEANRKE